MKRTIAIALLTFFILCSCTISVGNPDILYITTTLESSQECYVYFLFVILHDDQHNVQHNMWTELGWRRLPPYLAGDVKIRP